MDKLAQAVVKIIQEQEKIIGPIALEQAKKVNGLNVNWDKHEIILKGNKKEILESLIDKYKHLFGQASVEVCKDAVRGIISDVPKDQVPQILLS